MHRVSRYHPPPSLPRASQTPARIHSTVSDGPPSCPPIHTSGPTPIRAWHEYLYMSCRTICRTHTLRHVLVHRCMGGSLSSVHGVIFDCLHIQGRSSRTRSLAVGSGGMGWRRGTMAAGGPASAHGRRRGGARRTDGTCATLTACCV